MIGLILLFSTSSRRKSRSWRWIFAKQDGGTLIFTAKFQAHLPDADKPPLYLDLPAQQENGQLIIDSKRIDRSNMIKGTGFAGL
jgi:hypothetical protein